MRDTRSDNHRRRRCENAELHREIGQLRSVQDVLLSENRALSRQIKAVEGRLEAAERAGKRQSAPFSKGGPQAAPRRPGRHAGAEYGRAAHRERPDHVDENVAVELPTICECGGAVDLEGTAEQFQEDVPMMPRPVVTRFVVPIGRCRRCGRRMQGRHPRQTSDALGVAASQVGPRAAALGSWLMKRMGLPARKAVLLMAEMTGVHVTAGGLVQAAQRVGDRCQPTYDEICRVVRQSPVVSPDETGWRIGGRNAWLWDFVTPDATAYRIEHSRGVDVIKAVLGEDFSGVLVRDGWAPYMQLGAATHQTCLAHLVRRCHGMLETARGRAREIPLAVKSLLLEALAVRDRRDRGELGGAALEASIAELEARLAVLLDRSRITRPANRRLLKHLRREQHAMFTFLRRRDVEATNFRAEQGIRPAVVNRKVWGGNRTRPSARAQEVLMSVMQTCHQRRADVVGFLADVQHAPRALPPVVTLGWENLPIPAGASP